MKLIAKYNRITIPITVVVLLISSIAYYFILHKILIYQLDKDLRIEQQEILQHIRLTGTLPETSDFKDQQIIFLPTNLSQFNDRFATNDIYKKDKDEVESIRRIDFLVTVGAAHFIATVKKPQQETEDMVQLVLAITLTIIVFLLLILFVSNRFLLRKLWEPFQHTLLQLKQFTISSNIQMLFHKTDIKEFKELNETVSVMAQKVKNEYETLKSFTENASHEIQTPLAIIINKVELLSQSENLTEGQLNVLQNLNEAAARLSRLNQSLLLLTKIDNNQFAELAAVNFSKMLFRYLDNIDELADAKGLKISKSIMQEVFLNMNESLAEILISNVISNAIKHNVDNGNITVEFNKNYFRVSNTGPVPHGDTTELFERFKKESSSVDSLGLGLSIVKTITDIYGFSISYYYKKQQHIVEIIFKKAW